MGREFLCAVRAVLPAPEYLLLWIGMLWTVIAKVVVLGSQAPGSLAGDVIAAVQPDIVFFLVLALLMRVLGHLADPRMAARLSLLAALVVLGWSVLNAAWAMATGIQLQPGVLGVLLKDPGNFWPVVQTHLARNLVLSIPIAVTGAGAGGWLCYRVVYPFVRPTESRRLRLQYAAIMVILLPFIVSTIVVSRRGMPTYSGQVLGFSSHAYALRNMLGLGSSSSTGEAGSRSVVLAGERMLRRPEGSSRPNILIVFLESVSWNASSFGSDAPGTTPFLESLAEEGTLLRTYVPVSQTSKAFWAGLTGTIPDLDPDSIESVLMDSPAESLATILGTEGYASAFFQMSMGAFSCTPGIFANLGFDKAWFRENLRDPSASLGYMNGDDFRMLDPMYSWIDSRGDSPWLMVTISSVSHDPYDLPAWYEVEETADRYQKYLQSVRFNDDWLREIVHRLEARGLGDNTIICVMGDHGDGFRPESTRGRWAPFEEVIMVPWVLRWGRGIPRGRMVEEPVSQLDLSPTLLSVLGYEVAPAGFEGIDALGELPGDRRHYFTSWFRDSPLGYVRGRRKYVFWPYTDVLYRYDLGLDPAEKSPDTMTGPLREQVIADLEAWQSASRIDVPVHRFRESFLYDHWRCFSAGRSAWAYFVDGNEERDP